MGGVVEGVIAVMGLMAGVMVAITALLSGDAPGQAKLDQSHHPRTIRLREERMAA